MCAPTMPSPYEAGNVVDKRSHAAFGRERHLPSEGDAERAAGELGPELCFRGSGRVPEAVRPGRRFACASGGAHFRERRTRPSALTHRPESSEGQTHGGARRVRDLSPARSAARRTSRAHAGRASTGRRAPARAAKASTRSSPRRTSTGEHQHYDPETSLFLQPDPYVQAPFFSQSLNRFAYVFNNPLKFVDPSGFQGTENDKGGGRGSAGGGATGGGKSSLGPNQARDARTGQVFDGRPGQVVSNVHTGNSVVNTGRGWIEFEGDGAKDAADLAGAMISTWSQPGNQGTSQTPSVSPGAATADSPGQSSGSSPGSQGGPGASGTSTSGASGGAGAPARRGKVPEDGSAKAWQDALIAAAFFGGESPSSIRTDGTGSALGAPGGGCEDCEGGRGWQAMILLGTAAAAFGPAAVARGIGAAKGAGAVPTFGNLGDDAAGAVIGELNAVRGGYRIGGQLAEGSYDFVVQQGRVIVGRGHAALAGGGRVTYAGEATFRGGQIVEWTNASGHFRPAAAFAGNAGLPMGAFRSVQFPGFLGGTQLPVLQ
jgi:hypothetical protein